MNTVPDLEYIRQRIPVDHVAADLGLRRNGSMFHCWRPENHQHGDRTASVGLYKKKNKLKCQVCDPLPLSVPDLVMSVKNVDIRGAIRWVTSRFPVPSVPKGKHVSHNVRWPERFRVGVSASTLEFVVRSGVWAELTRAQRAILPVLDCFSDPTTRKVMISYPGIMRYSGIGSRSTVSSALRQFQKLHLLSIQKDAHQGLRACNSYHLTFDDPAFLDFASQIQSRNQEAIALERKLRAKARERRRSVITGKYSVQKVYQRQDTRSSVGVL